jgi:hypothetical protein
VLNVSKISDRNRARSKNHVQEGNIFAFCSPVRAIAILQIAATWNLDDGSASLTRRAYQAEWSAVLDLEEFQCETFRRC